LALVSPTPPSSRRWPAEIHYVQEDSPDEIGRTFGARVYGCPCQIRHRHGTRGCFSTLPGRLDRALMSRDCHGGLCDHQHLHAWGVGSTARRHFLHHRADKIEAIQTEAHDLVFELTRAYDPIRCFGQVWHLQNPRRSVDLVANHLSHDAEKIDASSIPTTSCNRPANQTGHEYIAIERNDVTKPSS
jgi:hypothetical protein